MHFEQYTAQDGLSNDEVTCIFQDHDGFLWIGTHFGLSRFDGNIFVNFYHSDEDTESISGNNIVDMLQDSSGIFWIATKDGGLTRYDPGQPRGKQFRQFTYDPAKPGSILTNRLTCLFDYNKNYLLIGAEGVSAVFLNKKTLRFSYYNLDQNHATVPVHNPFLPDRLFERGNTYNNWLHHACAINGKIYLSFLSPMEVLVADIKTGVFDTASFVPASLTNPDFEVDGDTIWLASWSHGLYIQQNQANRSFSHPLLQKKVLGFDDECTTVISWDKNLLLAGTMYNGLYLVDKKTLAFTNVRHSHDDKFSIASNKITCMFRDRSGILWIGTSKGISKYNPYAWQLEAIPITDDYDDAFNDFSVREDPNGSLRIFSTRGIYKKTPEANTFSLQVITRKGQNIEPTFTSDFADGTYLLGSEYGIFLYDPAKEKISELPVRHIYSDTMEELSSDLYARDIYQVRSCVVDTVDGHPLIFFGVLGWGVGIYDPENAVYYEMLRDEEDKDAIRNNLTRVLYLDAEKRLWVGTSEGLFRWKASWPPRNDFVTYINNPSDSNSISNNNITGLYEDPAGTLWVSTFGDGLNAFDGRTFTRFRPPGISDRLMLGLYPDEKGNLWIPTSEGFIRFDRTSHCFHRIFLPDKEWQFTYPGSILCLPDGMFTYATGNFLVSFYPDSIYIPEDFPRVFLTEFKADDEDYFGEKKLKNLRFRYNTNFFSLGFSSLALSEPGPVKYRYQLRGLNNEWVDADKNSTVHFTNLPPGQYAFSVEVTNAAGVWSAPVDLIAFHVSAPYWLQWWFYGAVAVCIALLVLAITRFRVSQFIKLQNMRNKIANDLHDDVGSALSTINLYSEVARIKSGDANPELRIMLDKISSTSLEMQENMSHIVWSLQPRNDQFEQMILRLKNYALETLQAKNIKTYFDIHEELQDLKLSHAQRKELFLIFKEALNNIIKYADCGEVNIRFAKQQRVMFMTIRDNGTGFTQNGNSTGNGLHSMQERAKNLGGRFLIHSKKGEGTEVRLEFPL